MINFVDGYVCRLPCDFRVEDLARLVLFCGCSLSVVFVLRWFIVILLLLRLVVGHIAGSSVILCQLEEEGLPIRATRYKEPETLKEERRVCMK